MIDLLDQEKEFPTNSQNESMEISMSMKTMAPSPAKRYYGT